MLDVKLIYGFHNYTHFHISKTEHNLAVKFHMTYKRKIRTIFLISKSLKVWKKVEAIHELYHARLREESIRSIVRSGCRIHCKSAYMSFYHVYCIPLMSGFLNQCYLQCAPFSCCKSYTHVSITFNNRPAILGTPSLVCIGLHTQLTYLRVKVNLSPLTSNLLFDPSHPYCIDSLHPVTNLHTFCPSFVYK